MINVLKSIFRLMDMPVKKYVYKQSICMGYMILYTFFSLVFPSFISVIVDKGIKNGNGWFLIRQCLFMLICGGFMVLFQYLQQINFYRLAQEIVLRIKENIFFKLTNTNYNFWLDNQVGDILTVMESDVGKIENLISSTLSSILVNLLVILGITGVLVAVNPLIGITVFILSVLFAVFQRRLGKKVEEGMVFLRKDIGALSDITNQSLNNMLNIRMFGMVDSIRETFRENNRRVVFRFLDQMKKIIITQMLGLSFNVTGIFFVLIVGVFQVGRDMLSVGVLFTMTIYVQRLYAPIVGLGNGYIALKNAKPIVDKILRIIETKEEIREGSIHKKKISGKLKFEAVSFAYREKSVLQDFSLEIKAGQKVAVTGENGSGKSTMVRLLAKLCESQKGRILLDDTDLLDYSNECIQKNIAIVPQNCFFLKGKLGDLLGVDGPNQREKVLGIMESMKIPIDRFSNGLETEISENMNNLSGGEIQKLALIKSILENKAVYILDEPTAAVDFDSEAAVCTTLSTYLKDKTVMVISHRKKILEICDFVIELQKVHS